MKFKLKRKWTFAPAWVDYLVQALYRFSYCNWPYSAASNFADRLLDRYCDCPQCIARAKIVTDREESDLERARRERKGG